MTISSRILFTQKEAAAYLGTTVGTLNTWRHYGKDKIPYVRWGNRIRYRKEDLDAWIEAQLVSPVHLPEIGRRQVVHNKPP